MLFDANTLTQLSVALASCTKKPKLPLLTFDHLLPPCSKHDDILDFELEGVPVAVQMTRIATTAFATCCICRRPEPLMRPAENIFPDPSSDSTLIKGVRRACSAVRKFAS
eukprot:2204602-Amphidinium_carterae.1